MFLPVPISNSFGGSVKLNDIKIFQGIHQKNKLNITHTLCFILVSTICSANIQLSGFSWLYSKTGYSSNIPAGPKKRKEKQQEVSGQSQVNQRKWNAVIGGWRYGGYILMQSFSTTQVQLAPTATIHNGTGHTIKYIKR